MYVAHDHLRHHEPYTIQSDYKQDPIIDIIQYILYDVASSWDHETQTFIYKLTHVDPQGVTTPLALGKRAFQAHLQHTLVSLAPGQLAQYRTEDGCISSVSLDEQGHYTYSYETGQPVHTTLVWCQPAPYHQHISDMGRVTSLPVSDFVSHCVQYLQSFMAPTTKIEYYKWSDAAQDRLLDRYLLTQPLGDHLSNHLDALRAGAAITYAIINPTLAEMRYELTIIYRDGDYYATCYTPTRYFSTIAPTPT